MLRVQLMDDETWDMRFRLLGVELMQAPLFGLAVLQLGLLLYVPRFSASSPLFDSLFTRRRTTAGPPSRRHQPLGRDETLVVNGLEGGDGGDGDGVDEESGDAEREEDGEDELQDGGVEGGEEEIATPLPDDLPTLLTRAGSVGGVPSPIVFFEAQALREMS
jgi:hypothetical protein